MITNDQELKAAQERLAKFQDWPVQMRQSARPEEFEAEPAAVTVLKLNECKRK